MLSQEVLKKHAFLIPKCMEVKTNLCLGYLIYVCYMDIKAVQKISLVNL